MANVRNGNTFFVDASSSAATAASFLSDKAVILTGIIAYGSATTDVALISDKSASSDAVGTTKIKLAFDAANRVQFIDLSNCPIGFPNGVWLTLTGSPVLTLLVQTQSR